MPREWIQEEHSLAEAESKVSKLFGNTYTRLFSHNKEMSEISFKGIIVLMDNTSIKFRQLIVELQLTGPNAKLTFYGDVGGVEIDIGDYTHEKNCRIREWVDSINKARVALFYERCQITLKEQDFVRVKSLKTGKVYAIPFNLTPCGVLENFSFLVPKSSLEALPSTKGESISLVGTTNLFSVTYGEKETEIRVFNKTWKVSNLMNTFQEHGVCSLTGKVLLGDQSVEKLDRITDSIYQQVCGFLVCVDKERFERFYRKCEIIRAIGSCFEIEFGKSMKRAMFHRTHLPSNVEVGTTVGVSRRWFYFKDESKIAASSESVIPPVTFSTHTPTDLSGVYIGETTTGLTMSYNKKTRIARIVGRQFRIPAFKEEQKHKFPDFVAKNEDDSEYIEVNMFYRGLMRVVFVSDDAKDVAIFCQEACQWMMKLHEEGIFD